MEASTLTAQKVEPVVEAVREELKNTQEHAHFDENGSRDEKKLWWLHVVCNNLLTYYEPHHNQDCKALDAIGIFPGFKGTAKYYAYRPYFQCDTVINALCNAHHLRDLSSDRNF